MPNMWKTAFVEQLEDGNCYVSRPNEFRNNEIFIEMGPFATETEAQAWLDEAWRECERSNAIERYHGMLAEYAKI